MNLGGRVRTGSSVYGHVGNPQAMEPHHNSLATSSHFDTSADLIDKTRYERHRRAQNRMRVEAVYKISLFWKCRMLRLVFRDHAIQRLNDEECHKTSKVKSLPSLPSKISLIKDFLWFADDKSFDRTIRLSHMSRVAESCFIPALIDLQLKKNQENFAMESGRVLRKFYISCVRELVIWAYHSEGASLASLEPIFKSIHTFHECLFCDIPDQKLIDFYLFYDARFSQKSIFSRFYSSNSSNMNWYAVLCHSIGVLIEQRSTDSLKPADFTETQRKIFGCCLDFLKFPLIAVLSREISHGMETSAVSKHDWNTRFVLPFTQYIMTRSGLSDIFRYMHGDEKRPESSNYLSDWFMNPAYLFHVSTKVKVNVSQHSWSMNILDGLNQSFSELSFDLYCDEKFAYNYCSENMAMLFPREVIFLSNLLNITPDWEKSAITSTEFFHYSNCVFQTMFKSNMQKHSFHLPQREEDTDDMEEDDVAANGIEGRMEFYGINLTSSKISAQEKCVVNSLKILFKPSNIRRALKNFVALLGKETMEFQTTPEYLKLLLRFIVFFRNNKPLWNSILNYLVYKQGKRVFGSVFEYMENFPSSKNIMNLNLEKLEVANGEEIIRLLNLSELSYQWEFLELITCMCSHLMLTYGKDEFYGNQNVIGISRLIGFSGSLRNLAIAILLNCDNLGANYRISGSDLLIDRILNDIYRTLKQLWKRDCQIRFCPTNHWVLNIKDLQFIHEWILRGEIQIDLDINSEDLHKKRPFIEILKKMPFVIDFHERIKIFRAMVSSDQEREDDFWNRGYKATIRRNFVFEDGFAQLNRLGSRLKNRVAITFIDEFGLEEAGIDGGGVFKEFLTSLGRQAFNVNFGLFQNTKDNLLFPNPLKYATSNQQLQFFEFMGRILGKALCEGILVDASFASFFLSKWLGNNNYLEDLPSYDQELYKNLMFLKNYEGNAEDLSLNFTVVNEEFGETDVIELVPSGKNLPVTNENRIRYIHLVANYKLNEQIRRQCNSFLQGLSDLVNPGWLRIFNSEELHVLVSGASISIDLDDMKKNTVYSGTFHEDHPTIINFWNVLASFDEINKGKLVKFITSCSRPPLLGFSELNPKICLRDSGEEFDRLPTAATCMNLLKMPQYPDENSLRKKLLYAINYSAGFDLS